MWVTLKRGSFTAAPYRFDQGRTWCTDASVLAHVKPRAVFHPLKDGDTVPEEGARVKLHAIANTGTLTVEDLKNAPRSHEPRVPPTPETEPVKEKQQMPEVPEPDTDFPCRFDCGHQPYRSEVTRDRHEAFKHGEEGTEA